MKKININLLIGLFALLLFSCSKEEKVDVNIEDYPINITKATEVDSWITQNLTDPYNIEVVYRFDRNKADATRNIAPANLDAVRPIMQMMLTTFMEPYLKTGGTFFGKEYFPKQWVLYGSYSYNTDNTMILGTMSNAKRMTLYGANVIDTTNGPAMERYMRTVHHEFTHSINQRIPIPPAYENITPGDYDPNWAGKSEAAQRDLGFISPYASNSYTEDFAEMVSHLVVQGPVWYNNFLALASPSGREKIKAKEAIVREYLLNNFGIDLTDLQTEVRAQLKSKYHVTDPADITLGFGYQVSLNRVNTITIDPTAAHYTTYGRSAAFTTVLTNYDNAMIAAGWKMRSLQFIFTTTAGKMTLRVAFTTSTTTTPVYNADYDFSYTINPSTGLITFAKMFPEGTGTTYSNGGATRLPPFEQHLLPYLAGRQFVAAYLPSGIPSTSPLYRTFAGFYVNGTPTNYFYGPVTYK